MGSLHYVCGKSAARSLKTINIANRSCLNAIAKQMFEPIAGVGLFGLDFVDLFSGKVLDILKIIRIIVAPCF